MHRPHPRSRAVVLLAVLIAVSLAALAGSTIIFTTEAEMSSSSAAARLEQSRLLAWSGVQAAMAQLSSMRKDLLTGAIMDEPPLSTRWEAWSEGSGELRRAAIFRLIPIGSEGQLAVPESARLDINVATEAMLAMLPGLDDQAAKKAVAERSRSRFTSVHDLVRAGIDLNAAGADEEADGPPSGLASSGNSASPSPVAGLSELLTVYSADPAVQAGMGEGGSENAGKRRINLNVPWSDALGEAVGERFGSDAAAVLKALMQDQKRTFRRDADVVKALRTLNAPASDWPRLLDAFCTSDDEYSLGRIDLSTARAEVLACVPGIDAEAAQEIVARRGKLSDDRRASVCWPVIEGILKAEQFEQAADWLTARSMQWRVVVEGGVFIGDAPADFEESFEPLKDSVVLEAVIDISGLRPRVAYLRDITMLPVAATLRRRAELDAERNAGGASRPPEVEAAPSPAEPAPVGPVAGEHPGLPTPPERRRPTSEQSPPPPAGSDTPDGGQSSNAKVPASDRRMGRWNAGGSASSGDGGSGTEDPLP